MEEIMGKRVKAFNNYEINKNIAKTLVLHRVWNGYTQTQLAKCINVSFQQIQKYERCINRLAAENLIDICRQKKWDIQLFLTDKPEAIFSEWCKQIPEHGFDTPYPQRASQIQRSWDKIDTVGKQNYYNEHSPRYRNIIKEMNGRLSEWSFYCYSICYLYCWWFSHQERLELAHRRCRTYLNRIELMMNIIKLKINI